MKTSTKVSISVLFILLAGLLFTDYQLAGNYKKIDLSDPLRNFADMPVKAFKVLKLTGGNGYSIHIKKSAEYSIKLLKSRKDFFTQARQNDTLAINFSVASRNPQQIFEPSIGIIISAPYTEGVILSGTFAVISGFHQDSLQIIQTKNSRTDLMNMQLQYLSLHASDEGIINWQMGNKVDYLTPVLLNSSKLNMLKGGFSHFRPVVRDASVIILNEESFSTLTKKEGSMPLH